MDPPPYSTPLPHHNRTITDLRSQILANASVIRPKNGDYLEVILAKPPNSPAMTNAQNTHWIDRQAIESLQGPSALRKTPIIQVPSKGVYPIQTRRGSETVAVGGGGTGGGAGVGSTSLTQPGDRHYAILVKRGGTSSINIILKGEPKATVEEALEWMLEQTEMMVQYVKFRENMPFPSALFAF